MLHKDASKIFKDQISQKKSLEAAEATSVVTKTVQGGKIMKSAVSAKKRAPSPQPNVAMIPPTSVPSPQKKQKSSIQLLQTPTVEKQRERCAEEVKSTSSLDSQDSEDSDSPLGRSDVMAFLERQFGRKASAPSTTYERRELQKMLDDLQTADARLRSRYICSDHVTAREVDLFKQGLIMGRTYGERGPTDKILNSLTNVSSAILVLQNHVMDNAKKLDKLSTLQDQSTQGPASISNTGVDNTQIIQLPMEREKSILPQKRKSQLLSQKTRSLIQSRVPGKEDQVFRLIDQGVIPKMALLTVIRGL